MSFFNKFPYTNFQEINLDWIMKEVSKVRDNRDASDASAAAALESETNAKASELAAAASQQAAAESEQAAAGSEAASAEYLEQIGTHTAGTVADWLEENLQPTTPPVDESLTVSGAAADAKVTGDRISDLNSTTTSEIDALFPINVTVGTMTDGGYVDSSTGTIRTDVQSAYSGFIPVDMFSQMHIEHVYLSGTRSICGYSSNSEDSFVRSLASGSNESELDFTVSSNITHIRITGRAGGPVPILFYSDRLTKELSNKTDFSDFAPEGLRNIIDFWENGQIRSRFPEWSSAANIMTTRKQIPVYPGMLIRLGADYSMIVIRSDGTAIRYNNDLVVNFTDSIWIEVNKTDNSNISPSERPVTILTPFAGTTADEIVFVNGSTGNDSNEGSVNNPFKTITRAVASGKSVINVAAGVYSEMVDLRNISHPITIRLWEMPAYDGAIPESPKIIIDGGENRSILYGILCANNGSVTLSDVHCKNTSEAPFQFKNMQYIKAVRCIASDSPTGKSGFLINNVNGSFVDCLAYNIGADGFNIHAYGDTEFINCVAHDCGDDGISHHDGCTGRISGGEYYNCTKGGVASPTYGAYIDIDGVYSHDNTFGIYAVSNDQTRRAGYSRISNSVFKNNGNKDIYLQRTEMILWNSIYDSKEISADSTLTEYGNN